MESLIANLVQFFSTFAKLVLEVRLGTRLYLHSILRLLKNFLISSDPYCPAEYQPHPEILTSPLFT